MNAQPIPLGCAFVCMKFPEGRGCRGRETPFQRGLSPTASKRLYEVKMEENKMGTMGIGKLVFSMSLPMMISMIVQALYNVVDSVFVAKIGEDALTAVSLAFPMQNFMIAVCTGTGVGVNALLSKRLGMKDSDGANRVANNGVYLAAFSYVLFLLAGLFVAEPFFRLQNDTQTIVDGGVTYLRIVMCGSFGLCAQIIMERLVQSTGRTVIAMITQGIGALINIVLDPVMIFGLLGCPALGIAGAAYATIIGQIAAAVLGVILNQVCNKEISVNPVKYRPDLKTIGHIYAIGVPSIIMQSIGSVMTVGMNKILYTFSSTAQAVFGVYFKLQSIIFMPVFGLNNGLVPIIAYNYGAQKKDRMMRTIKVGCIWAVSIMLVGMAVMELFPEVLLGFFEASEHMVEIGVPALRIICISFIFAGFCITVGSVFQALGNGVYSMVVSATRQLCVLLPVAYLMSLTGNLDLVWLSFPIAEIASVGLTLFFFHRIYKKVIRHVGEASFVAEINRE